jgi:hypothetical protein
LTFAFCFLTGCSQPTAENNKNPFNGTAWEGYASDGITQIYIAFSETQMTITGGGRQENYAYTYSGNIARINGSPTETATINGDILTLVTNGGTYAMVRRR